MFLGEIEASCLCIKTSNARGTTFTIIAPNRVVLFEGTLTAHEVPTKKGTFSVKMTISASEKLAEWSLGQTASLQEEEKPGTKARYTLATENLRGLKTKLRTFRILSAVFLTYFVVTSAALLGSIFTDNEKMRKYGRPTFLTFTLIFLGLFIAFLIAAICFEEETKKANREFKDVQNTLLDKGQIPIEELRNFANRYITENGMEMVLIKPCIKSETPPMIETAVIQNEDKSPLLNI